jgi:hypothetical protein
MSDENPPFECPYCPDRFGRARYRDLHLGQAHEGRMTAAERTDYEAAAETEREALRMFRLKALAALVAVYFGFLMVYAFTL